MRPRSLRRRRGGPTVNLAADLLRQARTSGNWMVLLLLAITLVAVLAAAVGQAVIPWLIYPAL